MKKGLSPLMSTILLLLFAGTLGGAVMTWGSTMKAEEQETTAGCENVLLKEIEIDGKSVCLASDEMNFVVQNIGKRDISKLTITLIGEKDINKYNYDEIIPVGDILRNSVQTDIGAIKKVIFVPGVKEGLCAEKSLEVEQIASC
ncbi:MAG: hypothetical protein KJ601_05465 [Nanoarchaeota archaeon]|nr:hypothetical protein [Nanoarchaeota archaeon]MBU1704358.1 hypothetical protein [Nanoarchaeota archaeon]